MFYAPVPGIINIFYWIKKKIQLIKECIILKMWWLERVWFETFSVSTQGCNWSEQMAGHKNVYIWFSVAFCPNFSIKNKGSFLKSFIKSQILRLYYISFCAMLLRNSSITACYFFILIKLSHLKPEIGYKVSVFPCAKTPKKHFFFFIEIDSQEPTSCLISKILDHLLSERVGFQQFGLSLCEWFHG